jgi:nitrogen-specific signal transduction histidine kinase
MIRERPFEPFESAEDASLLAQAIVDTVREPLLVLDRDLRVVVASRSFYLTFGMSPQATQGRKIYAVVGYEVDGTNWKLSVSDDGVGMPDYKAGEKAGLGTSLMKALAQQLEAQVDIASSRKGTAVSITHATFISRLPTAA